MNKTKTKIRQNEIEKPLKSMIILRRILIWIFFRKLWIIIRSLLLNILYSFFFVGRIFSIIGRAGIIVIFIFLSLFILLFLCLLYWVCLELFLLFLWLGDIFILLLSFILLSFWLIISSGGLLFPWLRLWIFLNTH